MLDSGRITVATQSKDAGMGFEYTTAYYQEVVIDQYIVCTISQILVEGFSSAWHIMAQYALKI